MNLTIDPWLPVLLDTGRCEPLSLRDTFARAQAIRDLALRPHERIAVMRLLLCITHAALDGPADHKEWRACRSRIAPSVAKYLARPEIAEAFNLFGEGQRFLQVGDFQPVRAKKGDSGVKASKTNLMLASGDNDTLLDHAAGSNRAFVPSSQALNLLVFQCFSPGGTIGVGMWGGRPTRGWSSYPSVKPGQSCHAPCLPGSMLHTFLRGTTLLETLYLNMLDKKLVAEAIGENRWGLPVWERMPLHANDVPAVDNATLTYVGRLAPLPRAISLNKDGRTISLANALDYPDYGEGFREPAATVVTDTEGEKRRQLGATLNRALWRELHALTVRRLTGIGGPLALASLDGNESFDLWVGALIPAKGKPGKIEDVVESVFPHLPSALLGETGQQVYERGVQHAEDRARQLWKAVFVYHKQIGDSLDRPDAKSRRDLLQTAASARFWTEAEQSLPLLLALVKDPAELGLEDDYGKSRWGSAVRQAARRAYEQACPRETARQLQAFVIGLKQLSKTESANA